MIRFITFILLFYLIACTKEPSPMPTISLLEAAKTGNLAQVKAHIYHKSKLDIKGDDGFTALDYAVKNDDLNMYKILFATKKFAQTSNQNFLLKHKLVKIADILPSKSVLEAARAGDLAQIRLHIYHKSKIDIKARNGLTALDYAVKNSNIEMYKILFATKKFSHTSDLGFLLKHKVMSANKILDKLSHFKALGKVKEGEVTLLAFPNLNLAKCKDPIPTVKNYYKQISHLSHNTVFIRKIDKLFISTFGWNKRKIREGQRAIRFFRNHNNFFKWYIETFVIDKTNRWNPWGRPSNPLMARILTYSLLVAENVSQKKLENTKVFEQKSY